MRSHRLSAGTIGASVLVLACAGRAVDGDGAERGALRATLSGESTGIVGVGYAVMAVGDDCTTGEPLFESIVALEDEATPSALDPSSGGTAHPFASDFFALPPGEYLICATPLDEDGRRERCGQASAVASVVEGSTTSVVLVSQCAGAPAGGLEATAVLNRPPVIEHVEVSPSNNITTCEAVTVSVLATDPDGDAIAGYAWNAGPSPSGSIAFNGGEITYTPDGPGEHTLTVFVSDAHGGQSSLPIPIHVTPRDCSGSCEVLFSDDFSSGDRGWSLDPEWQIGSATASEGNLYGNPDPAEDATATDDNGVAGVVIGGNAAVDIHGFHYLTSPVVPAATGPLQLEFWRWLNSDYTPYMRNTVEVFDGSSWVEVWTSGEAPGVIDVAWTRQVLDISAYANPLSRVRFGFEVSSSGAYSASGWNIDDVMISSPCD